jgi:hypothetical protein
MGKRQLRSVEALLFRVLEHLVLAWAMPHAPHARHWLVEAQTFQADLRKRYRAGMRVKVDVEGVWLDSVDAARERLRLYGLDQAAVEVGLVLTGMSCPFTLGKLVSADFLATEMVRLIQPAAPSAS